MGDVQYFADRMRWYCQEADVGYDQGDRWDVYDEGEADCSSLIITALRDAGFSTGDASYTGDMRQALQEHGWEPVSGPLQVGDILLAEEHHVAAYVGDGLIAEAAIDEHGDIAGGQPGDQTGWETRVTGYYAYPWDYILRYTGDDDSNTTSNIPQEDIDMLILTNENEVGYFLNGHSLKKITYPQAKSLMNIGVINKRVGSEDLYNIMEAVHESAYDMTVTAEAYRAAAARLNK